MCVLCGVLDYAQSAGTRTMRMRISVTEARPRPARIILPVCRETVNAWLACGPLLLLPFLLTSSSYISHSTVVLCI